MTSSGGYPAPGRASSRRLSERLTRKELDPARLELAAALGHVIAAKTLGRAPRPLGDGPEARVRAAMKAAPDERLLRRWLCRAGQQLVPLHEAANGGTSPVKQALSAALGHGEGRVGPTALEAARESILRCKVGAGVSAGEAPELRAARAVAAAALLLCEDDRLGPRLEAVVELLVRACSDAAIASGEARPRAAAAAWTWLGNQLADELLG